MSETKEPPPRAESYRARAAELVGRVGTVCVVDLETSGFIPEDGRAVEIGLVHFRGDVMAGSFSSPLRGVLDPRFFHNSVPVNLLREAPGFADVAPIVQSFIETSDVIVGQNVRFDLAWLQKEFERAGLEVALPIALDLIPLAKTAFPGLGAYNLDSVVEATGSPVHRPRHRALPDCMTEFAAFLDCVARLLEDGKVRSTVDLEPFLVRDAKWRPRRKEEPVPKDIAEVVDRLAERVARRELLGREIEHDEAILADFAARTGTRILRGKDAFASVGDYPIWRSNGDEASRLKTRAVLEEAGLYSEISEVTGYELARALESGRVPEKVVGALSAYGRLKRVRRVRVMPLK